MYKKKLLKLVKGLRSLTRSQSKHFDMNTWAEIDEYDFINGKCSLDPKIDPKETGRFPLECQKLSCDTAACALGWATAFFPRSNLKLKFDGASSLLDVEYTNKDSTYSDIEAGQKMFGLTHDESNYLFNPCWYPQTIKLTPKYVASRIEKLVETNGQSCKRYVEKMYSYN